MKKEHGITLIALAITIIVVLILSGILIQSFINDNGIIKNANVAKEQQTIAKEKELVITSTIAAKIAGGRYNYYRKPEYRVKEKF